MTAVNHRLPAAWIAARQWLAARIVRRHPVVEPAGARARPPIGGARYRPLYDYLSARHADRVMLTFGEVESLIDAALPSEARLDAGWWIADGAAAADAWVAADRCVSVNLKSQVVTYDRTAPARRARQG